MDKFRSRLHNACIAQLTLMVTIGLVIACTNLQGPTPVVQAEPAGRGLTGVTDDSAGVPRPQGTGDDIGAHDLPALSNTALPAAAGTTFYVSRTGSNGDGRSWATAWNELDQIKGGVIQPGDTILIDGGSVACEYPVTVTDSTQHAIARRLRHGIQTTLTVGSEWHGRHAHHNQAGR